MEEKKLIVTEQEQGKRLDVYLTTALDISRSYAQQLIQRKEVTVNGKEAKANRRLNEGDQVQAVIELQEEYKVVPQDIPLDIVYEDKDIIVVNKARGMVVHPARQSRRDPGQCSALSLPGRVVGHQRRHPPGYRPSPGQGYVRRHGCRQDR